MRTLDLMRDRVVEMRTRREVGRLLQVYIDGELDSSKVAKVTVHLDDCRRCGMEAGSYARMKDALARVGRHGLIHPEDRLSIERLRRFADSLRT